MIWACSLWLLSTSSNAVSHDVGARSDALIWILVVEKVLTRALRQSGRDLRQAEETPRANVVRSANVGAPAEEPAEERGPHPAASDQSAWLILVVAAAAPAAEDAIVLAAPVTHLNHVISISPA